VFILISIFCCITRDIKLRYNIIVGCTQYEPEPGWFDGMQGLAAVVTSVVVGFLRALPISKNKKADFVPVDYSANALISIMWDTVIR
jgi:alcohol-forming fatty acyl-CoA reductase